jgi:hypothetical protein
MRAIIILLVLCSPAMAEQLDCKQESMTRMTCSPVAGAPAKSCARPGTADAVTVDADQPCPAGMVVDGYGTIYLGPGTNNGCLPGEERVLRSDFSIGCAREVHPQGWH